MGVFSQIIRDIAFLNIACFLLTSRYSRLYRGKKDRRYFLSEVSQQKTESNARARGVSCWNKARSGKIRQEIMTDR
jgi:hypothetical protein